MTFSIIIPVYNVAPYLRECLDSVLAQTYPDWEAICVNDGSTDASGAILDEYAAKDSRFKVVHQPNAGVSVARSAALEMSRGEWVTFIDSDDTVNPDWLGQAVALMSDAVDLVRLRPIGISGWETAKTPVLLGRDAAQWGWSVFSFYGFLWLCFVRRNRIGEIRFRLNVRFKQDMLFLIETIPRLRGVVQGDFAGYGYRVVEGSASRKPRPALYSVTFLSALADIWREQRAWAEGLGLSEFVRERLRDIADNDILHFVKCPGRGNPRDIRRAYRALEREGVLSPNYCSRRIVLVWRWTGSFLLYRAALAVLLLVLRVRERLRCVDVMDKGR